MKANRNCSSCCDSQKTVIFFLWNLHLSSLHLPSLNKDSIISSVLWHTSDTSTQTKDKSFLAMASLYVCCLVIKVIEEQKEKCNPNTDNNQYFGAYWVFFPKHF